MDIKVNLNDYVKVKLTKAGIKKYENSYMLYTGRKRPLHRDADGYTELQLHSLIDTFGDELTIATNPEKYPFEGNNLYFECEDRKPKKIKQVKMFTDFYSDCIDEMNEFIKDKEVVDIKVASIHDNDGEYGIMQYLVIYEEDVD